MTVNNSTQPDTLYHYTTHDGLLGIVRSKSIWATNVHFLNDSSEFIHTLELFRTAINEKSNDASDGATKFLEELTKYLESIKTINIFVASFSEEGNLLSQWRAYCSNGGYSLGFNAEFLITTSKNLNFTLNKCIYDMPTQKEAVGKILDNSLDALKKVQHVDQVLMLECVTNVIRIAPLMKHSSFSEESEWRLISPVISIKDSNISFRSGKSMLVPYYVIPLIDEDNKIHIAHTIVGPNPHEYRASQAATQLMSANDVVWSSVMPSKIPYRDW